MKNSFSARSESLPFILPALFLGAFFIGLGWLTPLAWLSLVPFAFAGYAVFFFRDPRRIIPSDPNAVVSGADGAIVGVDDLESSLYYDGPCKRVSIFLSLFDVHINRAPVSGTVRRLEYRQGKFLDARLAETTDVNEANTVYMDTVFGPVTVRQIAGLVARRIVCRCEAGDTLHRGQQFGMIKFGSRTEIYLPPHAEVLVQPGQRVKAGETVVARFP